MFCLLNYLDLIMYTRHTTPRYNIAIYSAIELITLLTLALHQLNLCEYKMIRHLQFLFDRKRNGNITWSRKGHGTKNANIAKD